MYTAVSNRQNWNYETPENREVQKTISGIQDGGRKPNLENTKISCFQTLIASSILNKIKWNKKEMNLEPFNYPYKNISLIILLVWENNNLPQVIHKPCDFTPNGFAATRASSDVWSHETFFFKPWDYILEETHLTWFGNPFLEKKK